MVKTWLAWLKPVSRPLPVVLALPAPAPLGPVPMSANERQWAEIEALMLLPTVEPDYERHVYPAHTANLVDGGLWMAEVWPLTWGRYDDNTRELLAGCWLGKRQDVKQGELIS